MMTQIKRILCHAIVREISNLHCKVAEVFRRSIHQRAKDPCTLKARIRDRVKFTVSSNSPQPSVCSCRQGSTSVVKICLSIELIPQIVHYHVLNWLYNIAEGDLVLLLIPQMFFINLEHFVTLSKFQFSTLRQCAIDSMTILGFRNLQQYHSRIFCKHTTL